MLAVRLERLDALFNRIQEPAARQAVLADFRPVPGSPAGELQATFDVVLGLTPEAP